MKRWRWFVVDEGWSGDGYSPRMTPYDGCRGDGNHYYDNGCPMAANHAGTPQTRYHAIWNAKYCLEVRQ